ncbi:MAG: ERCC4 domain-containing protein, partial [Pseudonocardiales bacterium]|nr:ERCC4 domain-containing protein [Pseudonocardiales bacterium]
MPLAATSGPRRRSRSTARSPENRRHRSAWSSRPPERRPVLNPGLLARGRRPKDRVLTSAGDGLVDLHLSAACPHTTKRALPCGDYAITTGGRLIASVERKSLVDLVASLTGGKLRYALAELAELPRAAVVIEDCYSRIFKLDRVRPALVADGLAEAQVRWP